LHDQCRADICAEHNGERRYQLDRAGADEGGRHQRRRRGGLKRRGDSQPGEESVGPVAQPASERMTKVRAENARDPALDHVDAPEQKGDLADQVDDDTCGGHGRAILLVTRRSPPKTPVADVTNLS